MFFVCTHKFRWFTCFYVNIIIYDIYKIGCWRPFLFLRSGTLFLTSGLLSLYPLGRYLLVLVNDFSRPNRLLEKPPDQSTESHLIGCCVNSWVLASNWSKEIITTVSRVWFSRNSISMTLNTDISISLQFFTKRPSDLKS